MDYKDFISRLSANFGYTEEETAHAVSSLIDCMTLGLQEGKSVVLRDFGTFEVRKEIEYISINPLTKQRFLIPPCLRLCYVPDIVSGKDLGENPIVDSLTEQNLAEGLAKENEIADAVQFVESFFALIKKAMSNDKYVKVKGLGTFKVIDTGEKDCNNTLLYGNTVFGGVSFLPDLSLRDLINKPFAHFEIVPLKEHVAFDDLPEIPMTSISAGDSENVHEEETVETSEGEPQEDTVLPLPSDEQIESDSDRQNTSLKTIPIMRMPWCMLACVLLIGIIVGAGIIWGLMSEHQNVPKTVVQYWQQPTSTSAYRDDTIKDVSASVPSVKLEEKPVVMIPAVTPKKTNNKTDNIVSAHRILADSVSYDMVGTQKEHTLRAGESLTKLALKYYGNKKLWPYLVRYNQKTIKNPDNIPVGTIIQIPILTPKAQGR